MPKNEIGKISELLRDLYVLSTKVSRRRCVQFAILFFLQMISASMEVVSLGLVIPFLTALAKANELLTKSEFIPWFELANITTSKQLITYMAVLFICAVVLVNCLRIFTYWVQARLASAIGSDFSIEVFRRTLYQTYEFHVNANSGILISTITNDLRLTLSTILSCFMILTQGLVVLAIFLALMSYDIQMAILIGISMLIAYLIINNTSKNRLIKNGEISSDKYRLMIQSIQEGWGGIRDVLLDSTQNYFITQYATADRPMRRADAYSSIIRSVPRYLLEAVGIIVLVSVASIQAWRVADFRDLIPILGAMAMAASRLLPAVQQIYVSYAGMQASHISIKRTLQFLEKPLDPVSIVKPNEKILVNESISIEDVLYRYQSAEELNDSSKKWVLEDINLTVKPNTIIALVGETGAGKSTLADIIQGLLIPTKGYLKVDGKIMSGKELAAWRNSVAHVPQSIYLSDSTIKENIAFGVPLLEIDMEMVRKAAKIAQISDYIESKSNGYEETVGERGARLSGGQRQRIGIARALYKRASVIVFDEATSALDSITEKKVMDSIKNLSDKMTIILIAHRLSTIRNADNIIEVEDGRIKASGDFNELQSNSETFKTMISEIYK